jgi:hypothetical protein
MGSRCFESALVMGCSRVALPPARMIPRIARMLPVVRGLGNCLAQGKKQVIDNPPPVGVHFGLAVTPDERLIGVRSMRLAIAHAMAIAHARRSLLI